MPRPRQRAIFGNFWMGAESVCPQTSVVAKESRLARICLEERQRCVQRGYAKARRNMAGEWGAGAERVNQVDAASPIAGVKR